MTKPWQTIGSEETEAGKLELRKRGERDFLITIAGRVLMNSTSNRSEVLLSELACGALKKERKLKILIGGLGMGYTLKAALDRLPADARVVVAELNPVVVKWCQGPIAHLTGGAVKDSRVAVEIDDVAAHIKNASTGKGGKYDAIIFDLYEGPFEAARERGSSFYGARALRTTVDALNTGGVFAVWSEDPDRAFESRLVKAGFSFNMKRSGRRGHVVYLARKKACCDRRGSCSHERKGDRKKS